MPLVESIEDKELTEFSGSFAVTMQQLADAARDAGRDDIALLASDAADAAYILLDVLVKRPLGSDLNAG